MVSEEEVPGILTRLPKVTYRCLFSRGHIGAAKFLEEDSYHLQNQMNGNLRAWWSIVNLFLLRSGLSLNACKTSLIGINISDDVVVSSAFCWVAKLINYLSSI